MRPSGLFLRSRVARRTFWALLLAALAPLLVFGALAGHGAWQTEQARQQRHANEQLKVLGLRLHDRLAAARLALAAHAQGANWLAPAAQAPLLQATLGRITTVDPGGHVVAGPVGSPAAAGASAGAPAGTPWHAAVPRALWWHAARGEPARVLVGHPDPQGRGWWFAEVQPAYLWADFVADGPGAAVCVHDEARRVLHCPAAPDPALASAHWRLFLGGSFASEDWLLSGPRQVPALAGEVPLARLLGLGAAATLLLIVTLALVMVRRTLVPLEQLSAGTQRLIAGDFSARVTLGSQDEFALLAESFNTLAQRIGGQIAALEVQSAIDREILGALDVCGVMDRIGARMQALLPASAACVLAQSIDGCGWTLYRAGTTRPVAALPAAVEAAADDELRFVPCAHLPDWLCGALPAAAGPTALAALPARWQGATVAWLLFMAPAPLPVTTEVQRELHGLRDRAAVTLAAAAREHRLRQRAERDALTGLLNRHGLHDACSRAIGRGPAHPFVLLLLDLDGFKEVNDVHGHAIGDTLLAQLAQRLQVNVPAGDVLARLGGDEFVLLHFGSLEQAEQLAGQIGRAVAQPFVIDGRTHHVGASLGLAAYPADADERDELIRRADIAMYAAKAAGRGQWLRYAESLDARAGERAWIVQDLRQALAEGGLALHFQPRLALSSGRVRSVEALVRWPHPSRGWIAPGRFIPVIEDSELIEALGRFVLDRALAQQAAWRRDGVQVGRVAVNVSARQLRDPQFARQVLDHVAAHGLQPEDLELEITEGLFAGHVDTVRKALEPLRQRGVRVALDDFGTGYSSLAALQTLPVDVLKIDRSFVIELGRQESALAVTRSIVALARALSKEVVAEGVETAEQERHLLAMGCDEVQGYRYSRPLPGDVLARQLASGFAAADETRPTAKAEALLVE